MVHRVIDKGKASGFATTEVSPEAKAGNHIRGDFVHLGQFLSDLLLGDGRPSWMQDIDNLVRRTMISFLHVNGFYNNSPFASWPKAGWS